MVVIQYQVKHNQPEVLLLHLMQNKSNHQILKNTIFAKNLLKKPNLFKKKTASTNPLEESKVQGKIKYWKLR